MLAGIRFSCKAMVLPCQAKDTHDLDLNTSDDVSLNHTY
jgi:hypothetical protein